MPSYLEIAREALRQVAPPTPECSYSELTRRAVREIERLCPAGALQWARQKHPTLTDRIDVNLFVRLNDLWNTHAPLADFELALQELVEVHAEVGRLFQEQGGYSGIVHAS